MRRAVFLDRDGTLNDDVGYPLSLEEIRVFPQTWEAVRKLNEAGLLAIVVTNQSAVGRGWLTEEKLQAIHQYMAQILQSHGARIDAFYYCPHWVESQDPRYRLACDCRKPNPGMGLKAAADFDLDLTRSYMVGDKLEDLIFGHRLGAKSVLVLTGEGRKTLTILEVLKKRRKQKEVSSASEGLSIEGNRSDGEKLNQEKARQTPYLEEAKAQAFLSREENNGFRLEELEPDYVALDILAAVDWILAGL